MPFWGTIKQFNNIKYIALLLLWGTKRSGVWGKAPEYKKI